MGVLHIISIAQYRCPLTLRLLLCLVCVPGVLRVEGLAAVAVGGGGGRVDGLPPLRVAAPVVGVFPLGAAGSGGGGGGSVHGDRQHRQGETDFIHGAWLGEKRLIKMGN